MIKIVRGVPIRSTRYVAQCGLCDSVLPWNPGMANYLIRSNTTLAMPAMTDMTVRNISSINAPIAFIPTIKSFIPIFEAQGAI